MPHLMDHQAQIFAGNLKGMGYVKDSADKADNISFFISCTINTADNSTKVEYSIEVFVRRPDEYKQSFTNFNEAVDKYNELLIKWSGDK